MGKTIEDFEKEVEEVEKVPRFRLKLFESSFSVFAVKKWNVLPRALRDKPSIDSFKYNYKMAYFPNDMGVRKYNILLSRFRLNYTTLNYDLASRNIIARPAGPRCNFDLASRNIIARPACPRCNFVNESYAHFLLDCPAYGQSTFRNAGIGWKTPTPGWAQHKYSSQA
jgi:hypothetical protein